MSDIAGLKSAGPRYVYIFIPGCLLHFITWQIHWRRRCKSELVFGLLTDGCFHVEVGLWQSCSFEAL